ncbi:uroplakin-3b-like [Mantella aurantiaca]
MISSITLWLLVSLSAVVADFTSYIPQLTNSPIPGRITASTFVLDKPQCLFGKNSDNTVWLIVARSTVTLSDTELKSPIPYSSFNTANYYFTFNNLETFYNCSSLPEYIRVGDAACTSTFCNAPLPKGTYKVKFVVIDSKGTLVDKTNWSGLITLREGKDSAGLDTWPGRRSGAMIVITTILSVLLAAVFACLLGTLIVGRKNLSCFRKKTEQTKQKPIPQEIDLKNYNTHHLPKENLIEASLALTATVHSSHSPLDLGINGSAPGPADQTVEPENPIREAVEQILLSHWYK